MLKTSYKKASQHHPSSSKEFFQWPIPEKRAAAHVVRRLGLKDLIDKEIKTIDTGAFSGHIYLNEGRQSIKGLEEEIDKGLP
jgi:hypothetical protein